MRNSRRQIVIRLLEVAAAGIVILDLAYYFFVYRPLGVKVAAQEQQYSAMRVRTRDQQVRLRRLEKFQAALPEVGAQLADFKDRFAPPRRKAFSSAAHLIRQAADAAGVQPPSVVYRLDTTHHDPLLRLDADINTGGNYSALLKFAHALETADNFLLVRGFSMMNAGSGMMSLRLVVDFYVTP